jgi:hypothetical protein
MASNAERKAELSELSKKLQAIAMALRRISSDHPASRESLDHMSKELKAIAARLREDRS